MTPGTEVALSRPDFKSLNKGKLGIVERVDEGKPGITKAWVWVKFGERLPFPYRVEELT
jgi:hypothetical protein